MKKYYNAPMLKVYEIKMVSNLMAASTISYSVSSTYFDEEDMTTLSRGDGDSFWGDDEE